jgi:outer membrane protein assembly factor BamB
MIACVALVLITATGMAKRVPPKPVSPVISNGIRYSAAGDGIDQYVVAEDASTGKVLWKKKVFHTHINFRLEEDNQWVFITDLKLVGNCLLVKDEDSRCYSVDLAGRHVKRRKCGDIF